MFEADRELKRKRKREEMTFLGRIRHSQAWLYLVIFAVVWLGTDIALGTHPDDWCPDGGFAVESLVLTSELPDALLCIGPMLLALGLIYAVYLANRDPVAGLGNVVLLGAVVIAPGECLIMYLLVRLGGSDPGLVSSFFCACGLAVPQVALVWPLPVADLIGDGLTLQSKSVNRLRGGCVVLAAVLWALLIGYALASLRCFSVD